MSATQERTPTAQRLPASRGRKEPSEGQLKRRRRRTDVIAFAFLCGYAVVALAPIVIMVLNSLRPSSAIYSDPLALPAAPSLDSYVRAWEEASFATYFRNSVVVTVAAVVLGTAVSALAAYPLARYPLRGARAFILYFLAGLMLPVRLAILPIFYLLASLSLIDSHVGLVLVYAASGVPFSVFILTTFFRGLPAELEEAARIDGASEFSIFSRVMLPLVRPALATVAVFQFVQLWNDFFFPLVLLRSAEKFTIPVGMTTFFGQFQTDWSTLFAGLAISTVPLIVLFLVATKQIVAGLTAGIGK